MQSSEQAIQQRIRQGDTAALAEFLKLRQSQLLAYIGRNLSDALRRKVEPEDLFQQVSLDSLRGLAQVDLADRDPFGWLCQLAQRRIIDAQRRFFQTQKRAAGREVSLDAPAGGTSRAGLIDLLVLSMTSPSQAFSRQQREFRLLEAMASLPHQSRQALRLRYVQGLATKEIAQRLGKTDGAVRVMLTRSLKRLEQLLGPDAALP